MKSTDMRVQPRTYHVRPTAQPAVCIVSKTGFPTALVLSLACFVLLMASGCRKAEETPTPLVYVQAVHPALGNIAEQIKVDAILAPLAQAAISPKVTAPVKKFYVQRGSKVKAGQLLGILENGDLQAAALDNKGAYTAAQATFETATRATTPEDYTRAQLDATQAKATLNLNQSIVASRTHLFAQGAIPGRDLDTSKAALVQAQAAYDIAAQHLAAVKNVSHQASLQNAQGQLTSAKGKYLGAEAQLSYTEIRSPINGVITDRPLFAGETASAGTPVITVMDTSALLAKLHIAQMQAQQLTIGAAATLTVPGVDDPVPAKVTLVSPALDPGSTTIEVWLRVENRDGKFKAGTAVHASITGRSASNALLIPSAAVQTDVDGVTKSVMVISSDGTAHKRPVTLGIQAKDQVQVLSGITGTDTVITTGAYGLDEGTKVKVGTAPVGDAESQKSDESTPGKKDDAK
ncbi:MAG: efflux RND transporter periplasmic adaptor subunit [Acidobacteriota bacterium]|nr:efflux RND transporter periplasmic adaptor subunit [Acidobacteriota bacterium]